ncbi:MAG: hypothetical protein KAT77_04695 [Nanoarchaeota archaeon]|nr:hypothetical protein [Nanoarchaeota archaeon]
MKVYVSKDVQCIWNRLCELYTKEQRQVIYSDLEMVIEQTALAQGISLDEDDQEHKDLNQKITDRYIVGVYAIGVRYLHEVPEAKEIPVVNFTYEELFKEKPTDPEDQPG